MKVWDQWSPRDWDQWVSARPDGHVLQLSGWGALKAEFGWRWRRLAVGTQERPLAGAQLLLRQSMGLQVAYIPRGPLTDWSDVTLTTGLLDALSATARKAGASVLKIEPDLPDTPLNRAWLAAYGFRPSQQTIQPPSTIVIDLQGDEESVLQRMKSKWRYNVRLAERKGVTVRAMGLADLATFHALMHTTGQRDGFAVHSDDYFTAAYRLLAPDHAVFLLAEYEGAPLGAIVVAQAGESAWYLWGASSDRERNRMPNHALQWAGIRWAQARGAHRYDFWGIPDELGQLAVALSPISASAPVEQIPIDIEQLPQQGLWGVYRFKQGFGGEVVRAVGAWDMALAPVGFAIYQAGLAAQRSARELRRADFAGAKRDAGLHVAGRNGVAAPATPARLRPVATASEWRTLLAQLPDPHVLQSWEWGEIKGQTEWHADRVAVESPAGHAAMQFLWRQPLGPVPVRIGYVPKGPVLDWSNLDLVDEVLGAVEDHARALGCIFVKIDPDVRDDTGQGRLVLHALERRGWRYSTDQVQFKNTAYTDVRVREEALLAGMKNKWRYNVRLAEKRGITVREAGLPDLPAFYGLYLETGQRDGFLIRPYEYYQAAWTTMLRAQGDAGNPAGGALLLAEHAEEEGPVAGLFLFRYGARTWYFYGASSERRRRDMPNHLLQWEALRWAQRQGCAVYDWWGAPTNPDDADDSMQGVWQFKQGFGAEFQSHIGAWDFVVSQPLHRLYTEAMPAVLAAMRRIR